MKGRLPNATVQQEPIYNLLIAVVQRAMDDAAGEGLYTVRAHRRSHVQSEAADFVRWLRRDPEFADEH